MNTTQLNGKKRQAAALLALIALISIEFIAHRMLPFIMDDLWYSTNLATEEPLRNLKDILESQVWHYLNWGGRSMTHGALQLTLMGGELFADITNVIMMCLLTFMICILTEGKTLRDFLLVHSLLFALNANIKMSVLWQAGGVNYVYSSVWILVFLWPYIRQLKNPAEKRLYFVDAWILPFGILAGWSNENMGPTSALLAIGITVYLAVYKKKKPESWMITGSLLSLIGSILVVIAPGNFLRSSVIKQPGFYERFLSMLTAGVDYLLPCALAVIVILIAKAMEENDSKIKANAPKVFSLSAFHVVLLLGILLSYGAMALSPHYPDRATFGTGVFCIIFFVQVLRESDNGNEENGNLTTALTVCFYVCAMLRLIAEITGKG